MECIGLRFLSLMNDVINYGAFTLFIKRSVEPRKGGGMGEFEGIGEGVGFDGTSPHISTEVKGLSSSDPLNEEEWPPLSANNDSDSKGKRRNKIDLGTQIEGRLE
ncbi:hypothetical protein U1Q18_008620 [Sarracenia purpurea var. burkii]